MRIVGLLHQALSHLVVETKVEDGIHHTWHGGTGTGANGYKQWILHRTKLAVHQLLGMSHGSLHLVLKEFLDFLLAHLIIFVTSIGGNGEAWRYWHADEVHLCKVSTLATESLTHLCVTLSLSVSKCINSFFVHNYRFLIFIIIFLVIVVSCS